jgi:hypothetical protein
MITSFDEPMLEGNSQTFAHRKKNLKLTRKDQQSRQREQSDHLPFQVRRSPDIRCFCCEALCERVKQLEGPEEKAFEF